MKMQEVLRLVQDRLNRKLARARQAYLRENFLKITTNCLNRGRQLSGESYHCKINAMGTHELGASQCWNEKASICPCFELKKSPEELERQFENMSVEELKLRWPSIGELIRIRDWLNQVDLIHENVDSVPQGGFNRLSATSSEGTSVPGSGVSTHVQSGSGDFGSETENSGENRGDDTGGAKVDTGSRAQLSVAFVARSGDR